MVTYIAQFTAKHRVIQIEQRSVFIWRQESGDIDTSLLKDKIKRESSVHFYYMVAGKDYEVEKDDIDLTVWKTMPFSG